MQTVSARYHGANLPPEERLVGQTVAVVAPAIIRHTGPEVGKTKVVLGCKLETLQAGATVRIIRIVALHYADDTFFWGAIAGPQGPCPGP